MRNDNHSVYDFKCKRYEDADNAYKGRKIITWSVREPYCGGWEHLEIFLDKDTMKLVVWAYDAHGYNWDWSPQFDNPARIKLYTLLLTADSEWDFVDKARKNKMHRDDWREFPLIESRRLHKHFKDSLKQL